MDFERNLNLRITSTLDPSVQQHLSQLHRGLTGQGAAGAAATGPAAAAQAGAQAAAQVAASSGPSSSAYRELERQWRQAAVDRREFALNQGLLQQKAENDFYNLKAREHAAYLSRVNRGYETSAASHAAYLNRIRQGDEQRAASMTRQYNLEQKEQADIQRGGLQRVQARGEMESQGWQRRRQHASGLADVERQGQQGYLQQVRARGEMERDLGQRRNNYLQQGLQHTRALNEMSQQQLQRQQALRQAFTGTASAIVTGFNNSLTSVRRLAVGIGIVLYAVNQLTAPVDRLVQSFARMGERGLRMFERWGRSALSSAADMQMLQTRTMAIFGPEGKAQFDWLTKFSIGMPFDVKQLGEAMNIMGAFGLDKLVNVRKAMADVLDVASALGREPIDVAKGLALGALGAPGGMRRLRQMGITPQDVYAQGGVPVRGTQGLDPAHAAENAAAIMRVFEQKFGGTAKAMSFTWKQLIADMQDIWLQFSLTLSQTPGFRLLSDFLAQLRTRFLALLGEGGVQRFANSVSKIVEAFVPVGNLLLQLIEPAFQKVAGWAEHIAVRIKDWMAADNLKAILIAAVEHARALLPVVEAVAGFYLDLKVFAIDIKMEVAQAVAATTQLVYNLREIWHWNNPAEAEKDRAKATAAGLTYEGLEAAQKRIHQAAEMGKTEIAKLTDATEKFLAEQLYALKNLKSQDVLKDWGPTSISDAAARAAREREKLVEAGKDAGEGFADNVKTGLNDWISSAGALDVMEYISLMKSGWTPTQAAAAVQAGIKGREEQKPAGYGLGTGVPYAKTAPVETAAPAAAAQAATGGGAAPAAAAQGAKTPAESWSDASPAEQAYARRHPDIFWTPPPVQALQPTPGFDFGTGGWGRKPWRGVPFRYPQYGPLGDAPVPDTGAAPAAAAQQAAATGGGAPAPPAAATEGGAGASDTTPGSYTGAAWRWWQQLSFAGKAVVAYGVGAIGAQQYRMWSAVHKAGAPLRGRIVSWVREHLRRPRPLAPGTGEVPRVVDPGEGARAAVPRPRATPEIPMTEDFRVVNPATKYSRGGAPRGGGAGWLGDFASVIMAIPMYIEMLRAQGHAKKMNLPSDMQSPETRFQQLQIDQQRRRHGLPPQNVQEYQPTPEWMSAVDDFFASMVGGARDFFSRSGVNAMRQGAAFLWHDMQRAHGLTRALPRPGPALRPMLATPEEYIAKYGGTRVVTQSGFGRGTHTIPSGGGGASGGTTINLTVNGWSAEKIAELAALLAPHIAPKINRSGQRSLAGAR